MVPRPGPAVIQDEACPTAWFPAPGFIMNRLGLQAGPSAALGLAGLGPHYGAQRPSDPRINLQAASLHPPPRPPLPRLLMGLQLPPSKAAYRMWLALDLPLLRNIYSVMFANCERLEVLTPGGSERQGLAGRKPRAQTHRPPRKPSWNLGTWVDRLWPQASRRAAHGQALLPDRSHCARPEAVFWARPRLVMSPGRGGCAGSRRSWLAAFPGVLPGLPVSSHALRGWAAWRLGESPALGEEQCPFTFSSLLPWSLPVPR